MSVFREYKPETWARAEDDRPLIERAIRGAIGGRKSFEVDEFLGLATCCYCSTVENAERCRVDDFAGYVYRAIRVAVCREINRMRSAISYPPHVNRHAQPDWAELHDNVPANSPDDGERELACEKVEELMARLTPKQRRVIAGRYGIGDQCWPHTTTELARELGIVRASVYTNERNAMRRLRGEIKPRKSRRGIGSKFGPEVRRSVVEMFDRGVKATHVAAHHGMSAANARYIYNAHLGIAS